MIKDSLMKFLDDNNVDYITEGSNVKKGEVAICCPFCSDDPSHHMGINLETGKYGCWRNSQHRGSNLARVIMALVNCTESVAKQIIYNDSVIIDGFKSRINTMLATSIEIEEKNVTKYMKLPKQFKTIRPNGITRIFWTKFKERGILFPAPLISKFNIRCCLVREWKHRLIFPIYYQEKLVTWTSRSIYDSPFKHRDLDIESSERHVKRCLYNYDSLIRGEALFIVEGVFDCLKLVYLLPKEYQATCVFTKTITQEQVRLIQTLSSRFKKIYILLDRNELLQTIQNKQALSFISNISYKFIPKGVKDPAEMNKNQVLSLIA